MREPEPAAGQGVLPAWTPEPLRAGAESRSGNGFWAADGDVIGAALALDHALTFREKQDATWKQWQQGSLDTARLYSREIQKKRILELWEAARRGSLF
jgi:hypothetical protein